MKYEEQVQQIIIEPPPADTSWMWTGVVVPIFLAWLAMKKRKK